MGTEREKQLLIRSPSQCLSSGECQRTAWSAGWRCAPLHLSPPFLTTACSAAGPHAPLTLETGPEPQAEPGLGARREGTCSNR